MPRNPQLPLAFARPKRKKGGLAIDTYRDLIDQLRCDAVRVAEQFKLPPFELDADRPDARERYGLCHGDGRIRVRLINVRTGKPLRYSALIDTVVHELAHLRYMNHGPRWEALYERMLEWCRAEGIYTPKKILPKNNAAVSTLAEEVAQLGLWAPRGAARGRGA